MNCWILLIAIFSFEPLVGKPNNRENGHQRIVNQSHEQLNKEKKERTQDLIRFNNLPTSSGQGERVLIESINYMLQVSRTNIGDTTPPYIAKETTKKRKPRTPNSDQKRIQNQI